MLARRFIITTFLVLFVLVIIESTTGGVFLKGDLLGRTDIPAGTQIVRVTNLNAEGYGSLRSAVAVSGPKIIVFEVGGVIDLRKPYNLLQYCSTPGVDFGTCANSPSIDIEQDGTIIAGETAPPPGITLIGGAIRVHASNVIVRNIAVRMGKDIGALSQSISNGLKIHGEKDHPVRNILIENNSFLWAVDETASIFVDHDPAKPNNYDSNAISDVTLRYNIFGEGLSCGYSSTYSSCASNPLCSLCHGGLVKQHAHGTLVANGSKRISIDRNLYIHNDRRNPWIATDTTSLITNNLIYNPGRTAIEVNGCPYTAGVDAAEDFDSPQPGPRITAMGNKIITGKDSGLAIRGEPDLSAACGRETGRIVHVNECIPADAKVYQHDNTIDIYSPDGTVFERSGSDWTDSTDVRTITFPGPPTDPSYCPPLPARLPINTVIAASALADWTPITATPLLSASQVEATLLNNVGPSVWENKVQNLRWKKDPHDARLRSDVALRSVNGRRQSDPLIDLPSIRPLVTTQDDVCGVNPVTGAYDICGYPRPSQSVYATQVRSFDLTTLDPIPSGFLSASTSSQPTSSSSTASSSPRIISPLPSLTTGLIASFTMNDEVNVKEDSSPLGSDATFSQFVTGTSINGEQVAAFDVERNAYMKAESIAERWIGRGGFSMSAWIRPTDIVNDAISTAPLRGIVAQSTQGGFGTSTFQLYHNNNLLRFTIGDGTRVGSANPQADIVDSTVCLQNDTWHFVTAWYDPIIDTIGVSVNGEAPVIVSAINTSGFQGITDSGPLFIGSIFNSTAFSGVSFDGAIDDVRLWNRTLSSTERTNLFEAHPLRAFVQDSPCKTYSRIDDTDGRGFYGPRFTQQNTIGSYKNTHRARVSTSEISPETVSTLWLFKDVEAGMYDVFGTWKEASTNGLEVPVTIKVPGTSTHISAKLNQTLAPSRSFFSDGRWWQKVGSVSVSPNQSIRVQMFPPLSSGSQSRADAFMILRK